MATTFTFSVTSDTLNGVASAASLDAEIRADASVPIELVGVSISGDVISTEFQTDLDAGQVTALGAIVGAHTGVVRTYQPFFARRSDGSLRVVQEPSGATSLMQIVGFKIIPGAPVDAPSAPAKTSVDIAVTAPLDIQGVHSLWLAQGTAHIDDYLEFTIGLPAGTADTTWAALGLGAWPFGEATTTPAHVDLLKYGDHVYLPGGGHVMEALSYGAKTVAPPLIIRISYFAHEVSPSDPVEVRGNLKWWLLGGDTG